jgi:hypothetical protein
MEPAGVAQGYITRLVEIVGLLASGGDLHIDPEFVAGQDPRVTDNERLGLAAVADAQGEVWRRR